MGFLQLVEGKWEQNNQLFQGGTTQYKLRQQLKMLKLDLQQLNREHFSDISERAASARQQLEMTQVERWEGGTITDNYQILQQIAAQLSEIEHLFYLQLAKTIYFKEINCNTAIFHALMKKNNKHSKITAIEKADDNVTISLNEVV